MSGPGQQRAALAQVDLCCPHRAGDGPSRCQLWAGHHGPHAVMFARGGHRVVRLWTDDADPDGRDVSRGYETLPWMLGHPVPAWQES